jgi:hypothetical protein
VLLANLRPDVLRAETINDANGWLCNAWRALKLSPEATAEAADWPVSECVPAGTMIATPSGAVPVESVRPGMVVLGMRDGSPLPTVVESTRVGTAHNFMRLGPLTLTQNHPVWTHESGYQKAGDLRSGMNVARLDWPVCRLVLEVVYSEHGKPMGSLQPQRPAYRGSALCRSNHAPAEAPAGSRLIGQMRRQNAPRQLDTVPVGDRRNAFHADTRNGHRRNMGRSGTPMDCHLSGHAQVDQCDGRRGRVFRLHTDARAEREVVQDAERSSVPAWPQIGDAWKDTHGGNAPEDSGTSDGATMFAGNTCEDIGGTCRQGTVTGTLREDRRHAPRQTPHSRAQSKDRGRHYGTQTRLMCRNWRSLPIHHRGGSPSGRYRDFRASSHAQGLPLSRVSLAAPVVVYNFQTGTGNYFAAGILVHNCDLHARGDAIFYPETHAAGARLYEPYGGLEGWIAQLRSDPDFHDAKIAGYWLWGLSSWIGDNWGREAHNAKKVDRVAVGVTGARPHLGNRGRGVNRQLPGMRSQGVRIIGGQIGTCAEKRASLVAYFNALADRLRNVRICCGDWSRVMGPSVLGAALPVGVFLDPPYSDANRDAVYGAEESFTVAHDVRAWCLANGENRDYRIALCGYREHDELAAAGWEPVKWKAAGGYSGQGKNGDNGNRHREVIWFSKGCIPASQPGLGLEDAP